MIGANTMTGMGSVSGVAAIVAVAVLITIGLALLVLTVIRGRHIAALQSSARRLDAIVNTAADGIITIDRSGIVISFNPAAERMFGYAGSAVIGQNVSMLMPSPDREQHDGYLARYLETGVNKIIGIGREVEGKRKDGSMFPMHLAVGEFRVDDQPMFTGIVSDLTERQRVTEQLSQADRLASIGTLAAGLGHDMNNVLLPVRSRLDALDTMTLSTGAADHLDEIRSCAKYLQDLADGLHLLALNPDDTDAVPDQTDLTAWWEHINSLLARALPKHVRLATAWPEDLPPVAIAAHRLTQAVLNLFVNARTAVGDDGKVRVWAELTPDAKSVRLGVTDNGVGMTDEVRRRALDPFFSTKKRGLGTGLGLTLVHGVAQTAGGHVEIESRPGQGATIIMTLPVARPKRPVTARETPVQAQVSVASRRTASLVAQLVAMAGGEAITAEHGPVNGSVVWITDTATTNIDAAHRFLENPDHRLIIVGDASAPWRELGAPIVSDPGDFEALREAIADAVADEHRIVQ